MRYLVIGISLLLSTLCSLGCGDEHVIVDYQSFVTYVYDNQSGLDVELIAHNHQKQKFLKRWRIPNGNQMFIGPLVITSNPFNAHGFGLSEVTDSITVKFNNTQCLNYIKVSDVESNIFNPQDYDQSEQLLNQYYQTHERNAKSEKLFLAWTFTSEDVVQANDYDMF